jgi:hypothetical protein
VLQYRQHMNDDDIFSDWNDIFFSHYTPFYHSIVFIPFWNLLCCITIDNLFQPIKKPVRTLSIFTSMAFVKDANGISFKNRLKGHIHWRKVRNFIIIWMDESI